MLERIRNTEPLGKLVGRAAPAQRSAAYVTGTDEDVWVGAQLDPS